MRLLAALVPPRGTGRALAAQSAVWAIGSGFFLSASAVFFTQVVGLSSAQVGLGLSAAALVSTVTAVPVGTLIDRLGARLTWIVATVVEAALFGAYPLVRGFFWFLLLVTAVALASGIAGAARSSYVIELTPDSERVQVFAYQRVALNLGFTVGAGLGAVVLWIDSRPAYLALPLGCAVMTAVNGVVGVRLPRTPATPARPSEQRPRAFAVFADLPFLAVSVLNGLFYTHATLLAVVIPLWVIERTDGPRPVLALLVAVNTGLVVLLQVRFSRGTETVTAAASAFRRSGLVLGAACLFFAFSAGTSGGVTVTVLVLGITLLTCAEMFQASAAWSVGASLPPPALRGQYLGALRMARQMQGLAGPAALTVLVVTWQGVGGWLVLTVVLAVAALAAGPVLGWAARTPRIGDVPTDELSPVSG